MTVLRPYQTEGVDAVSEAFKRGKRRVILTGPTGMGKTECALEIVRRTMGNGKFCEFIADRQNLVRQTSKRFDAAGIRHGILMGNETRDTQEAVRVSSAQTIESRGLKRDVQVDAFNYEKVAPHLVILDECHEQRRAKLLPELLKEDVFVVGLTATPFPPELCTFYEELIPTVSTQSLIKDGWLSRVEIVSPEKQINTEGLKVTAGDWVKSEVSKRVLEVVGDVVPEWERAVKERYDGKPQQTIVFGATIADAEIICQKFKDAGHNFEVVHSKMTSDETSDIIQDFRDCKLLGIVNCAMLTRGTDFPSAVILVNCYPTRSFVNAVQKFGRIMRIYPGKAYGLIIDHAGDWLGFLDDLKRFYQFGPAPLGDKDGFEKVERKKNKRNRLTVCSVCGSVF